MRIERFDARHNTPDSTDGTPAPIQYRTVNPVAKEEQMKMRLMITLMIGLTTMLVWAGMATAQDINVTEAVVCQDVVDRMPVGAGDVIPAGTERVYCFTRIVGAQTETEITHNWYYQGSLKASVVLPVRNANWRTWSSKTLLPEWKGEWMVEVLSKDGTPLESIIFFVQ
jgi:hypothetical protein